MGRKTAENDILTRLWHWLSPPVPAHIQGALEQAQFDSVRKQVPMLLSVAALNTIIIMAVCAHDKMPPASYLWMTALVAYCVVRIAMWIRRMRMPIQPHQISILLRMNVIASLGMMVGLGIATTYTFVAGTFQSILLIPVSLGFGATSIAHCLYTLRPAAIGTVIIGLFPSSIAMILIGPFEAQMLGVSMISVGLLMVRFVAEQYNQLISSLMLADANRRLALTDPLTGLANRRSIMATLDDAIKTGGNFAVALIDLDGFKAVNDNRGHHAGDRLLCAIAERLYADADESDEVGRLGGDEFIVLFRNAQDEAECSARANALLGALCRPVAFGEEQLRFGASLGFAVHRLHGDSVEQLLHSADEALYAAKRATKDLHALKGRSARLVA
jgi:diguanylate cyclase (GGDEF)-like protein